MMESISIDRTYLTFIFPFSYQQLKRNQLIKHLEQDQFILFDLEDESLEGAFYPDGLRLSHEEIGQFFYPFMEEKLFPQRGNKRGFFRFSKKVGKGGCLHTPLKTLLFEVVSLDVWVCPVNIGMITTRVKLSDDVPLSDVLHFIHYFRVLEPQLEEEKGATIELEGLYEHFFDLLHLKLLPYFRDYLVEYNDIKQYGGIVPFFEDERMFTSAYLQTEQVLDATQLYRIGQVDSYSEDGQPFISSTNPEYIKEYVDEHVHVRWAPHAYTVVSNQMYANVTNQEYGERLQAARAFFGTAYCNLIVHYFYKVILLKLSFEHSEISWKNDKFIVDELIEQITKFSSHYYFDEVCVRNEGREMSTLLRKQFRIEAQYISIKETLNDFYRILEDQADQRQNQLLFMLTIFSMISGIYGMNLIIEDWENGLTLSDIEKYNFYEWISFGLALTGIFLSLILVAQFVYKGIARKVKIYLRARKR